MVQKNESINIFLFWKKLLTKLPICASIVFYVNDIYGVKEKMQLNQERNISKIPK